MFSGSVTARLRQAFLAALLALGTAQGALAALFEANPANFGVVVPNVSDCDDCFAGPFAFGAGHSLNFFGNVYTDIYISSNGYVTFGAGASNYSAQPLDTQTIRPMIAGLFTDLYSGGDATSNVYVNTATPGQIIVTWLNMDNCCSVNLSQRSTLQLVIRSDQFAVPAGQGQIGFSYGDIARTSTASAGFGDGLAASNPGEVAFHNAPANQLSNAAARWYNLSGGVPVTPTAVAPVPTLSQWAMIVLSLIMLGAVGVGHTRTARSRG